ncbi:DUF1999 domain-containing protein [Deinococcus lacus]|uniref:DUF1999 domain-containing protein n=1 Tax=Deinococcus lacus TaxID=392561 RepID=A0ABW1Y933_9DEIO
MHPKPYLEYRAFGEDDYPALQALDLAAQQRLDPGFEQLPDREREGRLCTSLSALKFYERSEHSFVCAAAESLDLRGFIFAQSVWQGDKPAVLVRSLVLSEAAPAEAAAALLRAVVKSAYDSAVYEIHYPGGLLPGLPESVLDLPDVDGAQGCGGWAATQSACWAAAPARRA